MIKTKLTYTQQLIHVVQIYFYLKQACTYVWRPSHRRHLALQPRGASKPCCLGQSTNSRAGSAPRFSFSSRSALEGSARALLHTFSEQIHCCTPILNKSYSIAYETFSYSQAHTRVHSTRHPQPSLQIAVKIRARNMYS